MCSLYLKCLNQVYSVICCLSLLLFLSFVGVVVQDFSPFLDKGLNGVMSKFTDHNCLSMFCTFLSSFIPGIRPPLFQLSLEGSLMVYNLNDLFWNSVDKIYNCFLICWFPFILLLYTGLHLIIIYLYSLLSWFIFKTSPYYLF